jgi:hypothetical protein
MTMSEDRTAELLESALFGQAAASKEILAEGDTAAKTIELATNAMGYAGDLTNHILELEGFVPACRKGCSHCCHVLVYVTAPEALAIAGHIRETFTPQERERLDRAIEDYIATTTGMTEPERMGRSVPCPLLVGGCCSIYDRRPIACRIWHSSDAERCRAYCEDPASARTVVTDRLALAVGGRIAGGLAVALRSRRLDDRPLELVRALQIALADPTLLDTWRSRPGAFNAAVLGHVHPRPITQQRQLDRARKEDYRKVTCRPEWSEIRPEDGG